MDWFDWGGTFSTLCSKVIVFMPTADGNNFRTSHKCMSKDLHGICVTLIGSDWPDAQMAGADIFMASPVLRLRRHTNMNKILCEKNHGN